MGKRGECVVVVAVGVRLSRSKSARKVSRRARADSDASRSLLAIEGCCR